VEIFENFQPAIRQQNFPQFFDYQSKNSNASSAATHRLVLFSFSLFVGISLARAKDLGIRYRRRFFI